MCKLVFQDSSLQDLIPVFPARCVHAAYLRGTARDLTEKLAMQTETLTMALDFLVAPLKHSIRKRSNETLINEIHKSISNVKGDFDIMVSRKGNNFQSSVEDPIGRQTQKLRNLLGGSVSRLLKSLCGSCGCSQKLRVEKLLICKIRDLIESVLIDLELLVSSRSSLTFNGDLFVSLPAESDHYLKMLGRSQLRKLKFQCSRLEAEWNYPLPGSSTDYMECNR